MRVTDIQALFDYNYWANRRILHATHELSTERYNVVIPGLSHGSIRKTLVHILAAENIWRLRCLEGVSPTTLLQESDFPTLHSLKMRWVEEEQAMRSGLARLTDEALAAILAYQTTDGRLMKDRLGQILIHVVNHGTQHRAEAAVALTAFGHSPGDVDLIIYLRQ
jgi:uncharacterized damage-inducible protein DinB